MYGLCSTTSRTVPSAGAGDPLSARHRYMPASCRVTLTSRAVGPAPGVDQAGQSAPPTRLHVTSGVGDPPSRTQDKVGLLPSAATTSAGAPFITGLKKGDFGF